MDKEEVIKLIGKERWNAFIKFMTGQTVGFKNGKVDYYETDVDDFISGRKPAD
jgi:hypothetical protein